VLDDQLADEVRITVIAAGFDQDEDEGRRSHADDVQSRPPAPEEHDDALGNGRRSALDISDDDSDVPEFLK
jgi:cell division GTPase FtsZ